MKAFRPTRIVGGSVIAENEPFWYAATASYHGAEILDERPAGDGPNRGAQRIEARRVVVREPHEHIVGDGHFISLFQETVAQTAALAGTAAPQLLHVFGRDRNALALVEESVTGVRCNDILAALHAQGRQLPPHIAVAIASELVDLWRVPAERGQRVDFYLGIRDVLVTADGRVRAKPELASDRARQAVGAMVIMLDALVAYVAPEQVDGNTTLHSGMYTLGLILYELVLGMHPVALDRPLAMMPLLTRIRNEDLPVLGDARPVLTSLSQFVARATARNPDARFGSWAQLAAQLAAVRAAMPPVGPADVLAALPQPPPVRPPLDGAALAGWRSLPHDGLVAVPARHHAPPAQRELARHVVAPDYVYPESSDGRPMLAFQRMLVDVRPVSSAELARFAVATGRGPFVGPVHDGVAATNMSFEVAHAYAAWAGKRLPTEHEWTAAVAALGADRLGTGEVWEWTATPHGDGRVVCGGRWRNARELGPSPTNRSSETGPAPDVGFRCVRD